MIPAEQPQNITVSPPRPIRDIAAELMVSKRRTEQLQAELLERIEAPGALDLRRIEVPGVGRIAYVSPSESDPIDGKAAARKLAALGAAARKLVERLGGLAERLRAAPRLPFAELGPALEQLASELTALDLGDIDDEIPTTHSARRGGLRITFART
jgi:hypothetical protein